MLCVGSRMFYEEIKYTLCTLKIVYTEVWLYVFVAGWTWSNGSWLELMALWLITTSIFLCNVDIRVSRKMTSILRHLVLASPIFERVGFHSGSWKRKSRHYFCLTLITEECLIIPIQPFWWVTLFRIVVFESNSKDR